MFYLIFRYIKPKTILIFNLFAHIQLHVHGFGPEINLFVFVCHMKTIQREAILRKTRLLETFWTRPSGKEVCKTVSNDILKPSPNNVPDDYDATLLISTTS